jgi:hypothetical protein
MQSVNRRGQVLVMNDDKTKGSESGHTTAFAGSLVTSWPLPPISQEK